jgi:hypothetical protein
VGSRLHSVMPIQRGSIYGSIIPGKMLADPEFQGNGKYKFFLVLQGDEQFKKHPYRIVALINTAYPPFTTTATQLELKNVGEQFVAPSMQVTHGYIDLSFLNMVAAEFIRDADYAGMLSSAELTTMNYKIMAATGIIQ